MLSSVGMPRWSPPPSSAERIDAPRVEAVLDRYLDDDWGQRVQVGAVSGLGLAGTGVGATVLGLLSNAPGWLAGSWGVGVACGLGVAGGIALGLGCTRHFFAGARGESSFMNAYMLATIGGFGGLITAFAAQGAGLSAGLIAAAGVSLLGAVAGGAMRMGASGRAQKDLDALERDIDRATKVEGIVLRNAQADEKAAQPGGTVKVEDDFIVVGGIRVPRGEKRP